MILFLLGFSIAFNILFLLLLILFYKIKFPKKDIFSEMNNDDSFDLDKIGKGYMYE